MEAFDVVRAISTDVQTLRYLDSVGKEEEDRLIEKTGNSPKGISRLVESNLIERSVIGGENIYSLNGRGKDIARMRYRSTTIVSFLIKKLPRF